MGRTASAVAVGFPSHVTHRGNHREPVFFSDADRRAYQASLAEGWRRFGPKIWAYCLMPNHVHFLVVPVFPRGDGQGDRAGARTPHAARP